MAKVYTWTRLDVTHGLGQIRSSVDGDSIVIDGTEVVADARAGQWTATFRVTLDSQWRTRSADVTVTDSMGERRRRLESDGEGEWLVDGVAALHLDGCLDIDIGAVPFTNTFIVQRHRDLPVGDRIDVRVVFLDVPSLTVGPLAQTYRRDAALRWTYRDPEFGNYHLSVDPDGIVTHYPNFARLLPSRGGVSE